MTAANGAAHAIRRAGALILAIIPLLTLPSSLSADSQEVSEVITLINVSADRHHVDPDFLGKILWCESRWDAKATGWEGSQGIAQFQPVTWAWAAPAAGWPNSSPYEAEAAIDVMAWLVSRGQSYHWKACGG